MSAGMHTAGGVDHAVEAEASKHTVLAAWGAHSDCHFAMYASDVR